MIIKTSLLKMEECLVLFISLFLLCTGDQLTPFIAWSNRDVLTDIPAVDDINTITTTLATKKNDIEVVIIFASDELSFDDLSKYASVYNSDDDAQFHQLKTTIKTAGSSYWTGLQSTSNEWISDLAIRMGMNPTYAQTYKEAKGKKFIVINMKQSNGWRLQDDIIEKTLKELSELSYLAIYTQLDYEEYQRDRRDVPDLFVRSDSKPSNNMWDENDDCPVGGLFNNATNNKTSNSNTCIIFCLKNISTLIYNNHSDAFGCWLYFPYSITYCCSDDNHESCNDNDGIPSVTLYYAVNASTNKTKETVGNNFCEQGLFNKSYNGIDIAVKFMFPYVTNTTWTVNIDTTFTNIAWFGHDTCTFSNMARVNPNQNLYQQFVINRGLSYACAAHSYNAYNSSNDTVDCSCCDFDIITVNATVALQGLQVQIQPFINPSQNYFSTAYNCVGYFTEVTWMGIVSVAILLLILYVSILCVFSMKSIDKFEDPRGQTITVEKLH